MLYGLLAKDANLWSNCVASARPCLPPEIPNLPNCHYDGIRDLHHATPRSGQGVASCPGRYSGRGRSVGAPGSNERDRKSAALFETPGICTASSGA